ncbi:uncharacterized protein LOC103316989 isoform X4 [Nasonia vitripennis]|nr:uncharacterized protein LOC103316989 isoform X4 [Nasonia vitripennis]XP_032457824.1 uncharacterized protein LOC103316989 isoform X4 [Nasonia vitripennis]XP_032457825.1 uncharacterized protein LOC103316989 isoform X4 [Nasonia vitripennis]
MTDPQLVNNNNQNNSTETSNNYNNNNHDNKNHNHYDGEPKYRHKKFKKMATCRHVIDGVIPDTKTLGINADTFNNAIETRKLGYVCPYCKISCAKPSVLQKHIRAHTNERPYPCVPCGFAFKTKSNLYKHCRSRAHTLKMEGPDTSKIMQTSSQLSEDSDVSLSDGTSNGTNTPPPMQFMPLLSYNSSTSMSFNSKITSSSKKYDKIYKPKFHTVLHDNFTIEKSRSDFSNNERLHGHIESIIDDNATVVDPKLRKLLHRQNSLAELVGHESEYSRKRCFSECVITDFNSEQISDCKVVSEPQKSPGPLLGNTKLIEVIKQPRLEHELSQTVRPNSLQMFGGEVKILDTKGERKTMRIDLRPTEMNSGSKSHNNSSQNPETASIVVRSSLHSGGTMLHKIINPGSQVNEADSIPTTINLSSIAPNISTPSLAPSVSCLSYLKQPAKIFHDGRMIPYVPGIPGPENLSMPLVPVDELHNESATVSIDTNYFKKLEILKPCSSENDISTTKFLRPSSLPLKPGTFTPKRHHGITPNAHTLALISPETPRPKKSYGQLYLNGHAYTYLGLKCSTKLFYCTLNRPQPMYVRQQDGLSMYSNWKICKEALPSLELNHYDSRHRPARYTLAYTRTEDILTHSSQRRPNTPISPDSGLECDGQDKSKRNILKIFSGGFESNEDYTYVRGRGRGRYVCEECGIRCKKPSMLKKHIRTHTDVRPYTCKYCAFSFKTKGNLTKHMKSKTHYKKCVDLKILPVPTNVEESNIDKDALSQVTFAGVNIDEISSSEEDSEHEAEIESDESGCEEHEAAKSLLQLAIPQLSGLLSTARPATYPYSHIETIDHIPEAYSRISVIRTCKGSDESNLAKPMDLTTKQIEMKIEKEITSQIKLPSEVLLAQSVEKSTQYKNSNNILSKVSGSALLQSIVQTMKRLPMQEHNWPIDLTEGRMLQAYLTERHLMDSKLKQHCRINIINREKNSGLLTESIVSSLKYKKVTSMPPSKKFEHVSETLNHIELTQHLPFIQSKLQSNNYLYNKTPNLPITDSSDKKQQVQFIEKNIVVTKTELNLESSSNVPSSVMSKGLEIFEPSSTKNAINYISMTEDTRNVCSICNKVFNKPSQLRLHINIHYFERPFRCESCGTSFRTKGHLTKHERSTLHHNKVSMTSTFGAATASNPRPFKCTDCKSAFRIHGHLAKHLRSKMHIMKLECLRKLPFGTYAEAERSGINLNDIDTTDCDTSLASLQVIAQKLCNKDPSNIGQWEIERILNHMTSSSENSSDESDTKTAKLIAEKNGPNISLDDNGCSKPNNMNFIDIKVDKISNELNYKCQLCPVHVNSINELHIHCVVAHKTEVDNNSIMTVLSVHKKKKNENENTHDNQRIEIFAEKIQ